jgi:hypothetical protein
VRPDSEMLHLRLMIAIVEHPHPVVCDTLQTRGDHYGRGRGPNWTPTRLEVCRNGSHAFDPNLGVLLAIQVPRAQLAFPKTRH